MENAIRYRRDNSKVEIEYGIVDNEAFINVNNNSPGIHQKQ